MIKKSIVFCFIAISVLTSCKNNSGFATMDFSENEYDFGTIKEGQKVEKEFTFKNNGAVDLLITNVQGSCGCTVGEYPKEAVKPNAESVIKVSFNSTGKHGKQEKSVTITANTKDRQELLKIYADVK
ncbi:DUF1573 domain-containing protein [Flavobacterium sp. SUN052]|uniref:DUF1573 domain-containing protein n=1 Tax=Flavobacterium sp. SUN052 TaxID=3002441 RepID=UPI00237E27D5|nr:DUF1573 domain-containing protein [Flavobacterium sp. SUN052]MEC4005016.1 DUF1573 domain-containing protein [Flavobacterium sp. SUN052]